VIEELGFRVTLWNGGSGKKTAGLSIKCGLYWTSPTANAGMSNCVTLDLPEDLGDLKQVDRMSAMLAAIARAWEPDWAGVDWLVYVPRRIDRVLPPSSAIQLENGSLIVVQPDPPTVNNTEDQENIRRIESILR
jgi:hypothetical protein